MHRACGGSSPQSVAGRCGSIVSDRGYFIFLALLPFIVGVLSLAGAWDRRLRRTRTRWATTPSEPGQILVLLNVGAIFMGTALTIRDLIGERAIFRREQAVGLSTTAYLLAKIWVYSTAAIIQSAILVAIVVYGKGGPTQGDVVVGNASVGLFVSVAGTSVAGAMLGLALSALARSNEQIMPMLVVLVISQLVFCGGMIPVAHRLLVDQLSWFTPARWGFAASASTVDLIEACPHAVGAQTIRSGNTPRSGGSSTWACLPCCASAAPRSSAGRSGSRASRSSAAVRRVRAGEALKRLPVWCR